MIWQFEIKYEVTKFGMKISMPKFQIWPKFQGKIQLRVSTQGSFSHEIS